MASHTSTGEWKSFELRMRKRRAERLLLRAGTAAENGHLEEARDCIAEARRLAPGLADIAEIEAKLDHPAAVPLPTGVSPRVTGFILAGAAVIVAGLVTVAAVRSAPAPVPIARDLRGVALSVPSEAIELHPVAPRVPTPATPTESPRDVVEASGDRSPGILPVVEMPAATRRTAVAITPASLEVPTASTTLEVPGAPAAVSAPTISAPPAAAPAVTRPDETAAVRDVLNRYAAAYSDLDAAAAQQVWPGVDQATLARAFDGLASQRVSLGDCRVDVTGATARATCAGSATWAPKIGDSSPRTERREWSFDLARSGGDWRILNARVQNR